MIAEKLGLIFIHAPKTGGNFVTRSLLPFSSEAVVAIGKQDGVDDFELRGAYTVEKHASLQHYASVIPKEDFGRYQIACVYRDPVDRMVSLYFSPHRVNAYMRIKTAVLWFVERCFGSNELRHISHTESPLRFSLREFRRLVKSTASISDLLKVNGEFVRPDFVLRFPFLSADLHSMLESFGEQAESGNPLNRSTAENKAHLSQLAVVRAVVMRHHGEDFDNFSV